MRRRTERITQVRKAFVSAPNYEDSVSEMGLRGMCCSGDLETDVVSVHCELLRTRLERVAREYFVMLL